jgi:prepilin-type N-terminal cleavage/methylation domain-containing protein
MISKNRNIFVPISNDRATQRGVSLAEVMVCVLIFGFVAVGLFRLFIYCSSQADLSRNLTLAVAEAQNQLETLRTYPYNQIVADYADGASPGDEFNLTQLTGKGTITIDASNPKMLIARIAVCWRNQNGRVIGEDLNLDGDLVTAEDVNADGKMDSLVVIESYIAQL